MWERQVEEIRELVKAFKRRTAPGPDAVPIEFVKEMDVCKLNGWRPLLNEWSEKADLATERGLEGKDGALVDEG